MKDLDKQIPTIIKKASEKSGAPSISRAALRAQEKAQRKAEAQQRLLFIFLGAVLLINLIASYFLYGIMVQDVTQKNAADRMENEVNARISDGRRWSASMRKRSARTRRRSPQRNGS